jgi:hypothetical protein
MQRRTKTVMVRVRVNVEGKTAEKMVAIREATAGKGFGHLERLKKNLCLHDNLKLLNFNGNILVTPIFDLN